MHIALTGASGFIGSYIARAAARDGHTVTALVRETSRRDHIDDVIARFVVADHADESAWPDLLDGADAIIHNSLDLTGFAPNRDSDANYFDHLERNLLATLKLLRISNPRPFIYISSIAVHHDMRARWNGDIDEDHPLRPSTDYGAFKAGVEPHLWADHYAKDRHTVAIRPCAVYGLDPKLSRTHGHPIVKKIAAGEPFDKQGGGKFVHVQDVADATVASLTAPDAAGRPFNMVDCYARWADWATMAADVLGVDARIDLSSPQSPKNTFTKDATRDVLGVSMDRGYDGIRQAIVELVDAMRTAGDLDEP